MNNTLIYLDERSIPSEIKHEFYRYDASDSPRLFLRVLDDYKNNQKFLITHSQIRNKIHLIKTEEDVEKYVPKNTYFWWLRIIHPFDESAWLYEDSKKKIKFLEEKIESKNRFWEGIRIQHLLLEMSHIVLRKTGERISPNEQNYFLKELSKTHAYKDSQENHKLLPYEVIYTMDDIVVTEKSLNEDFSFLYEAIKEIKRYHPSIIEKDVISAEFKYMRICFGWIVSIYKWFTSPFRSLWNFVNFKISRLKNLDES